MTTDFSASRVPSFANGDKTVFGNLGDPYCVGWVTGDRDKTGWLDPVHLLPPDPFGMGLSSVFSSAIAGWMVDLGAETNEYEVVDDCIPEGLSYPWEQSWMIYEEEFGCWEEDLLEVSAYDCLDFSGFRKAEVTVSDREKGVPHDALLFVLGYLGVLDLLSVERVCKTLHFAVQNDPLLWRCTHIDSSLSEKLTDDALLRLTSRAHGSLRCLNLAGCSRITDNGLKRVLESNPRLTKLSVAGCVRLSIDGLVYNLKAFNSMSVFGIKHLRLGGLFGVSQEHYEGLKLLLGTDQLMQPEAHKPRFYHIDMSSMSCDEECAIDIEICPRCQKLKLVYDCPSESCCKEGSDQQCRACGTCIARCIQCGECIKNSIYMETFCLDHLCYACWKKPSYFQEGTGGKNVGFSQSIRFEEV